MKSEWICHRRGAEKILKISEKYFANRQNNYTRLFPEAGPIGYRPWMSRSSIAEEVVQNSGNRIQADSRPFPSKHYVEKFCALYGSSSSMVTFSQEEPARPYAELYEKVPNALQEQENAFNFIIRSDSWMSVLADKLIVEILPIAIDGKPYNGLGGVSDPALMGAIFLGKMTDPFARVRSVISLAHELGHQALMMLQTIDNIAGKNREIFVYSGVREVERPLLHSLHAAIALVYMIEAANMLLECDSNLSKEESAYLEKLKSTHMTALYKGYMFLAAYDLSPIGNEILKDIEHFSRS